MNSSFAHQPIQQSHFWDQSFSFISKAVRVEIHRHRCFQVVITLTGTFDCSIDGQELRGLKGFVVNQNIPHSCQVNSGEVFVSFIDADSYWGDQLQSWLAGKPYMNLAHFVDPVASYSLLPDSYEPLTNEEMISYINVFFKQIFPPISTDEFTVDRSGNRPYYPVDEEKDERILTALAYIQQHLHQRLLVEDIAAHINLSSDRTRHLFAHITGIPISQYVLWKRIKSILKATINRESTLAGACIDFGFVDQPHFNRQFKKIFGTTPNTLIKGGRVIF